MTPWQKILDAIKTEINPQSFQTWLKPTRFSHVENGELFVETPTEEHAEWIEENFQGAIERAIQKLGNGIARVRYIYEKPKADELPGPAVEDIEDGPADVEREMPQIPDICWRAETKTYRDLVSPCSHSPDAFHLACFFTLFGALLSKSVHINLPHETYPNLYTLLVDPSGITGKTTAMKWISNALIESPKNECKNLIVIESLDSGEGLIEEARSRMDHVLNRDLATVLIFVDEFNSILRKAEHQGSKLIPTLKQAYDPRSVWSTITKHSRTELRDPPMLSLLCGSETADLADMNERDIRGGLGNRNLPITGTLKKPDYQSIFRRPEPHAWQSLIDTVMRKVRHWHKRKSTEVLLSDEVMHLRWKKFFESYPQRGATNEKIRQMSVRDPGHVAKAALIYAALDADCDRATDDHLAASIAFIDYCLACRYQIFENVGIKPWVKDEREILGYIRRQEVRSYRSGTVGKIHESSRCR